MQEIYGFQNECRCLSNVGDGDIGILGMGNNIYLLCQL